MQENEKPTGVGVSPSDAAEAESTREVAESAAEEVPAVAEPATATGSVEPADETSPDAEGESTRPRAEMPGSPTEWNEPTAEATTEFAGSGELTSETAPAVEAASGESEAAGSAGPHDVVSADELLADAGNEPSKWPAEDAELTAMLEAVIYVTEEPLSLEQISTALEQPRERIKRLLDDLVAEWLKPHHGIAIREVAGGYKMATKPEHHDAVRQFVKNLKPPMKLSLPALETLAVIAYKQPVTAPEVMDIRGVQGAGVLKTLIDRKLIAAAGRKNVLGKPILYKTTKDFLVQFGLKDLSELPSVKEFEELARFATSEPEPAPAAQGASPESKDKAPQASPESHAAEPPAGDASPSEPAAEAEEPQAEVSSEEPQPEPAAEPVTE